MTIKEKPLHIDIKTVLLQKRENDLLNDLRSANICGCGNCQRRALATKEFYDGENEAEKYREPEQSPFSSGIRR